MKLILFLFLGFLISCSSKEITEEKDNYVFDQVELDSLEINKDINQSIPESTEESVAVNSYYLVQIGAFTSEQRAKKFAEKTKKMLNEEIIISFSDKVNLYLVQLEKRFSRKSEAEIVRNNLRLFPEFQDAWIVTINE